MLGIFEIIGPTCFVLVFYLAVLGWGRVLLVRHTLQRCLQKIYILPDPSDPKQEDQLSEQESAFPAYTVQNWTTVTKFLGLYFLWFNAPYQWTTTDACDLMETICSLRPQNLPTSYVGRREPHYFHTTLPAKVGVNMWELSSHQSILTCFSWMTVWTSSIQSQNTIYKMTSPCKGMVRIRQKHPKTTRVTYLSRAFLLPFSSASWHWQPKCTWSLACCPIVLGPKPVMDESIKGNSYNICCSMITAVGCTCTYILYMIKIYIYIYTYYS